MGQLRTQLVSGCINPAHSFYLLSAQIIARSWNLKILESARCCSHEKQKVLDKDHNCYKLCSFLSVTPTKPIIIAKRLSARHIIRHYDLIQRFYVCTCMYVCQSRSGMQFSTDVLYQPCSIRRMRISVTLWFYRRPLPPSAHTPDAHKATHSTWQASCIHVYAFIQSTSFTYSTRRAFPFCESFRYKNVGTT